MLRASCTCTSVVMIRAGVASCATCSAPISADPCAEYRTRGGSLPAGRTARWLREHAPKIAGARREGTNGRSVVWIIPAAAYAAYVSPEQTKPTAARSDVELADEIITTNARATRRTA